jgi:hypothetical protein
MLLLLLLLVLLLLLLPAVYQFQSKLRSLFHQMIALCICTSFSGSVTLYISTIDAL